MSELRQISVEEKSDVSVVRFANEKIIDPLEIQEMGEELRGLVENDNRSALLLNFDGVKFLSSAALGKLIKLDQVVKQNDGRLKLSNIRADLFDVFKITNLHNVFDIRDTEEDALAGFAEA